MEEDINVLAKEFIALWQAQYSMILQDKQHIDALLTWLDAVYALSPEKDNEQSITSL